jgi:hypothetical protein
VTTTAFSPWRGELGSSCAADVFRYLVGCFRLKGGRVYDGVRWIYKVVREIAEATGYCERKVRRALLRLVHEGWITREQKEKHGIKPGDGGFRRRYWYAPGPNCPVPLRGRHQDHLKPAPMSASSVVSKSAPVKPNPSKRAAGKPGAKTALTGKVVAGAREGLQACKAAMETAAGFMRDRDGYLVRATASVPSGTGFGRPR